MKKIIVQRDENEPYYDAVRWSIDCGLSHVELSRDVHIRDGNWVWEGDHMPSGSLGSFGNLGTIVSDMMAITGGCSSGFSLSRGALE